MNSLEENHLLQVISLFLSLILYLDVELIKNNAKLGAEIAVALSNLLLKKDIIPISGKRITIIGGAAVDIIAKSASV